MGQNSTTTSYQIRCGNCNKLLAEALTSPWAIKCSRCRLVNTEDINSLCLSRLKSNLDR